MKINDNDGAQRKLSTRGSAIADADRLPIGRLCYLLDMRRIHTMPLVAKAGLPVEVDPDTGDVYTSRNAVAELFRRAVGAA